jgi:hypothetical protein
MARAVKLFAIFAIVTVVLHYIGPAARLLIGGMPEVLRMLAALGVAVEVPF